MLIRTRIRRNLKKMKNMKKEKKKEKINRKKKSKEIQKKFYLVVNTVYPITD